MTIGTDCTNMKTEIAPLPPTQNARPSRIVRWARRILIAVAATLLALGILVALFYTEENWRGHRAWVKCQRELESRGERLDWAAYLPVRVPDAQNFLKTPLLEAVAYRGRIDDNIWWPIERARESLVLEAWLKLAWHIVPRGWICLNLAAYNRHMQDLLPSGPTQQPSRISPREIEQLKRRIEQAQSCSGLYGWLAGVAIPRFAKALEAAARMQNLVNQAIVVCALERDRKAHGQYPELLSTLAPQFQAALPGDVITGGPLKYRRNSNGTFLLYSAGWNERDDHGVVAMDGDEPPGPDCTQGDWAWQYPVE
jgi:hypothetical protein